MNKISRIGLDIAKNVFQVHGVDAAERIMLRRQLTRTQVLPFFAKLAPCLVVIEACGTAHHWAREFQMLGHKVRLVPPAYARVYAKRGKSDAIDAEAVCEAGGRPNMRFVAVKSLEAQGLAVLHRTRALLDKQRTMLVNALRAHLAEFGYVAGKGIQKVPDLAGIVEQAPSERLPSSTRECLRGLLHMIAEVNNQLGAIEVELRKLHRASPMSQRLETVPGIGLITATALTTFTPDATTFKNGRHFAAWLGITPRQDSTGGKTRLLGISKAGDGYLRRLLVLGATSLMRSLQGKTTALALWVAGLLARRPKKVVIVALANKLARIAWAVMAKGEAYRPRTLGAKAQVEAAA
jgi:transposase